MLHLQIENTSGGWSTIERVTFVTSENLNGLTMQAQGLRGLGYCARIKDGSKVVSEFFSEDHEVEK